MADVLSGRVKPGLVKDLERGLPPEAAAAQLGALCSETIGSVPAAPTQTVDEPLADLPLLDGQAKIG